MKKLLLFSFLITLSFLTHAQSRDFILLKRGANQKSQIRYYPGEEITYKSKKIGYFITDVIEKVDQDYIYMSENIISPLDIVEVDIRQKDKRNRTLRALNTLVLGSGIILVSVDMINSLYHDGEISVDKGVGVTSAILLGTGLAMLPLLYKTFKHQGRNHIQIVMMRMD
ncbi:hypothetical protein FHS59_001104 [Algoriphagus iocasae]|uniref:Uncharacterized protein n=1 Tax=Algoriphagus iocasae TaxID=1836499 RepID=A0A841MJI7_9BACT|nr:hypothetical protein [Algoriphagus iocasae]MBB6325489.1 hypothetical protein [Algoriphagus iocasae]